jgi:S-adenosylmethionine:tRNA ribosyltransferase-isomerase
MLKIYNQLCDYDFFLPPELIATQAPAERSSARLMCLTKNQNIEHDFFYNLINYLKPHDLLVLNNTKVMKARIYAFKESGANVEILLVRPTGENRWAALLNSRALKNGTKIFLDNHKNYIEIIQKSTEEPDLYEMSSSCDLAEYARKYGEMPLPPYFNRKAESIDEHRYQTVYAREQEWGAVAAPTAGLHFTNEHMNKLKEHGIDFAEITLNVGPGTFLPIRVNNIDEHRMHNEYFICDDKTAHMLNNARAHKRRIIAVGTTVLRVLEHIMLKAHAKNSKLFFPCADKTALFIKPGHNFLAIDALITNFHTPKSTLFVLVSALLGRERAMSAYNEAIEKRYRFFSYGDSCYFEL